MPKRGTFLFGWSEHGFMVKVKYRPVGETEKKVRKQAIAQTILLALRRVKGK